MRLRLICEAKPPGQAVRWVVPSLWEERGEIVRQARALGISWRDLIRSLRSAQLVKLDDAVWRRMQNTESNNPQLSLKDLLSWTHRDVRKIVSAFRTGGTLPAPIVLFHEGTPICMAGNTRLCVSRVLGVRPTVLAATLK